MIVKHPFRFILGENKVSFPRIAYNYEYERKVKVCFIGAGGHSYRNVYPTFQYAPVDLTAVCDRDGERAAAYARQFGALRSYSDHREMLEKEKPDAVFIVTAYHADGRVQATDLALEALAAGCHVWMEKPAAASVAEIGQLIAARDAAQRNVVVGLKKIFFPAIEKAKQIIASPEFGTPASMYIRYPQDMPAFAERGDLNNMRWLLDHIYHPGAVIAYLMGNIARLSYEWEPFQRGSVTSMRFESGAVGTLHLVSGAGAGSPLERLEIVGNGSSVVVDNGVKVTYYRNAGGKGPEYGRSSSFMVDDSVAPLVWEPEFSLGQLYNKNIFLLGYVQEVLHFCESILEGTTPHKGTLEQSREIMKLFEAYRDTPAGQTVVINA